MMRFVFRNRVSLCSPDCPRTCTVDQVGLELRDPTASTFSSASHILGLKAHATTPRSPALLPCSCSLGPLTPSQPFSLPTSPLHIALMMQKHQLQEDPEYPTILLTQGIPVRTLPYGYLFCCWGLNPISGMLGKEASTEL